MRRSTGVTISSVVVIAGSAFTFLCGALMLLGSAVLSKSGHPPDVHSWTERLPGLHSMAGRSVVPEERLSILDRRTPIAAPLRR